jgi:hypothetical protein
MLIKQFLNQEELAFLKLWDEYLASPKNESIGYKNSYRVFDSSMERIVSIRNKVLNLVDINSKKELGIGDFVTEIETGGWCGAHIDATCEGHRHMRGNILIEKPEHGGYIVFEGKQIIMDEGDLCIMDPSTLHGVSTVTGDKMYKLISFGFSVPIK